MAIDSIDASDPLDKTYLVGFYLNEYLAAEIFVDD